MIWLKAPWGFFLFLSPKRLIIAFLLLCLVILKAAINLAQLKLFRHYYVMVSTDIIHCLTHFFLLFRFPPSPSLTFFPFHTCWKLWCPEGITLSCSVFHCFETQVGSVVAYLKTSFPLSVSLGRASKSPCFLKCTVGCSAADVFHPIWLRSEAELKCSGIRLLVSSKARRFEEAVFSLVFPPTELLRQETLYF